MQGRSERSDKCHRAEEGAFDLTQGAQLQVVTGQFASADPQIHPRVCGPYIMARPCPNIRPGHVPRGRPGHGSNVSMIRIQKARELSGSAELIPQLFRRGKKKDEKAYYNTPLAAAEKPTRRE